MATAISVRIPKEQVREVAHLSLLYKRKKSETLREILDLGLQQKKLDVALDAFQKKEATAWKAARLAGVPLTSFLDILKQRNILFHYSEEQVEQDFRGLI